MQYMTRDKALPFLCGAFLTLNFVVFWALPVVFMGQAYKFVLSPVLQPLYLYLEQHPRIRKFAADYVYADPRYADYFVLSVVLLLNCAISIPSMFYLQLTRGYLPWWAIYAYYCSWVGFGGTTMGSAYALAHKEGHAPRMYHKSLHNLTGNIFENGLGVFFGNVPWNFTTSHIKIHHATNGGVGDTFYLWDLDRSSFGDFMLYVHRILLHMIGYSSIKYFEANGMSERAELLKQGVKRYLFVAVLILVITRSPAFLFWFYVEPLICMTYFLAFINIGFHGFLEYDDKGKRIPVVDSTAIIGGSDDFWGEDDHMSHHYNTGVYYRDLPALQHSKEDKFKQYHASVFSKVSIMELSIYVVFGLYDELANIYIDYTGKLSKEEMKKMFKERMQRKETTYEKYNEYLHNPTKEARERLKLNLTGQDDDNSDAAAESKKSS